MPLRLTAKHTRVFLALAVIAGTALGFYVYEQRKCQQQFDEIIATGSTISAGPSLMELFSEDRPIERAGATTTLVGARITDAWVEDVQHLSCCTIRRLRVSETSLTDAGFASLINQHSLVELDAPQSAFGRLSARALAHDDELVSLNLRETRITGQELSGLRLEVLEWLEIQGCDGVGSTH